MSNRADVICMIGVDDGAQPSRFGSAAPCGTLRLPWERRNSTILRRIAQAYGPERPQEDGYEWHQSCGL